MVVHSYYWKSIYPLVEKKEEKGSLMVSSNHFSGTLLGGEDVEETTTTMQDWFTNGRIMGSQSAIDDIVDTARTCQGKMMGTFALRDVKRVSEQWSSRLASNHLKYQQFHQGNLAK